MEGKAEERIQDSVVFPSGNIAAFMKRDEFFQEFRLQKTREKIKEIKGKRLKIKDER